MRHAKTLQVFQVFASTPLTHFSPLNNMRDGICHSLENLWVIHDQPQTGASRGYISRSTSSQAIGQQCQRMREGDRIICKSVHQMKNIDTFQASESLCNKSLRVPPDQPQRATQPPDALKLNIHTNLFEEAEEGLT